MPWISWWYSRYIWPSIDRLCNIFMVSRSVEGKILKIILPLRGMIPFIFNHPYNYTHTQLNILKMARPWMKLILVPKIRYRAFYFHGSICHCDFDGEKNNYLKRKALEKGWGYLLGWECWKTKSGGNKGGDEIKNGRGNIIGGRGNKVSR